VNPDLYAALHTAGAWLAAHWTGLLAYGLAAAVLTVVAWALWPRGGDYRSRNDQREAAKTVARGPHPEPDQPGTNENDLLACLQIMRATDSTREEKP
jgi:hypothetical protein